MMTIINISLLIAYAIIILGRRQRLDQFVERLRVGELQKSFFVDLGGTSRSYCGENLLLLGVFVAGKEEEEEEERQREMSNDKLLKAFSLAQRDEFSSFALLKMIV